MGYVEKLIVTKIAKALLATGKPIFVDGERGYENTKPLKSVKAIVAAADQYDEVHIFVGGSFKTGYGPYVYLIFGNGNDGWDVVSDYITSLEPVLQPTLVWIEQNAD